MIAKNFISLFEDSFRKHWDLPAMENYEGRAYTFGGMAEEIDCWHSFFAAQGLQRGEKVALMGKDSAEWGIFFLAAITYGAVIVPILQDFPPADAQQIISHSEACILGINAKLWEQMRPELNPALTAVVDFQEGTALYSPEGQEALQRQLEEARAQHQARYPEGMRPEELSYYHTPNDELLVLNYTSGT